MSNQQLITLTGLFLFNCEAFSLLTWVRVIELVNHTEKLALQNNLTMKDLKVIKDCLEEFSSPAEIVNPHALELLGMNQFTRRFGRNTK